MQPLMRDSSAHACLMNALAVSEFLATFGVLCEASRLSLRDLQQAASSLSRSSALAQLYASLLRCVLLEKVSPQSCEDPRILKQEAEHNDAERAALKVFKGRSLCFAWCMYLHPPGRDSERFLTLLITISV